MKLFKLTQPSSKPTKTEEMIRVIKIDEQNGKWRELTAIEIIDAAQISYDKIKGIRDRKSRDTLIITSGDIEVFAIKTVNDYSKKITGLRLYYDIGKDEVSLRVKKFIYNIQVKGEHLSGEIIRMRFNELVQRVKDWQVNKTEEGLDVSGAID